MNKLSRMTRLLVLLLASLITNQANAFEETWSRDVSVYIDIHPDANTYVKVGSDGSVALVFENYPNKAIYWFGNEGVLISELKDANPLGLGDVGIEHLDSGNLVLHLKQNSKTHDVRILTSSTDTGWYRTKTGPSLQTRSDSTYMGYVKDNKLTVLRLNGSSSTSASNTNTSEGSGSDTETATTSTNYELLSSWCYFSEYPWVYSYTNKSWYYLMPSNSGLYAWNENINGDWFNLAAN